MPPAPAVELAAGRLPAWGPTKPAGPGGRVLHSTAGKGTEGLSSSTGPLCWVAAAASPVGCPRTHAAREHLACCFPVIMMGMMPGGDSGMPFHTARGTAFHSCTLSSQALASRRFLIIVWARACNFYAARSVLAIYCPVMHAGESIKWVLGAGGENMCAALMWAHLPVVGVHQTYTFGSWLGAGQMS
jgi:hypothetical protein